MKHRVNTNKRNRSWKKILLSIAVCVLIISCNDHSQQRGAPHDPSQPVVLESFYPDSGGMATKVIISGRNFGVDPSQIEVWYNDKRASVVGSDGEHLYVITPRQPGDTCTISVAIGNNSAVFDRHFIYRTMVTVTNIAGQKGTSQFKGGTLAEATFDHPLFLCVDSEKNIFVSMWIGTLTGRGNFSMINEKENLVTELGNTGAAGAPAVDITGRIVVVPLDQGVYYYSFDADAQWAPKRSMILHPTPEEQAMGMKDFNLTWKQGFATCQLDGMVYTYSFNGQLIKFDPISRKGQLVDELLPNTHAQLAFHPIDKHILYLGCVQRHAFYTYNINTKELELYAGTPGVVGWRDGNRLEAEFGQEVGQFVFDIEHNLVLADPSNHCIRKIDQEGMVSTIIGKGGVAGNLDGNSEDALFDTPFGVAIDEDYTIYIADGNNNRVRKLAIE
jgi:hypothetical protein